MDVVNSIGNGRPIEILLVDDNLADAGLTLEALGEGRLPNRLHHTRDGVEALEFLRGEGSHVNATRPDLILLDLNMPRKDGRQVLAELKEDPKLRLIPVVILTTSEAEKDIICTYELHANCFITKPVDLDKFIDIVRAIEDFWLAIVKLPSRPAIALH